LSEATQKQLFRKILQPTIKHRGEENLKTKHYIICTL
jgi:hypothetical protein